MLCDMWCKLSRPRRCLNTMSGLFVLADKLVADGCSSSSPRCPQNIRFAPLNDMAYP